jgi:cytochrome P450
VEPSKHLFSVPSEDPTALGKRLAAEAKERPIVHEAGVGLPLVLRKNHVAAALRNAELFSTRTFQMGILNGGLVSLQGEEHARMRRVYTTFFSTRAIDRYEQKIVRPIAEDVAREMEGKGRVDLLDAFASEMPKRVISALFGLSMDTLMENDERVRDMLRGIILVHDPVAVAASERAYQEVLAQITEVAEKEMKSPSDTMLGEIMRTLIAEDMATLQACRQIVLTLLLGGYETTIWQLANAAYSLLAHPAALARVRETPSLLPAAIEESMRWCPSTIGTVRYVEKDVTMDDLTLTAGTVVYLAAISVHYDEETYPSPSVFNVDRRSTPMIFGGGIHHCVGAPLARMESRVGLSVLLERFPRLRLDDSEKPIFTYGVRGAAAHGPDKLPAFLD